MCAQNNLLIWCYSNFSVTLFLFNKNCTNNSELQNGENSRIKTSWLWFYLNPKFIYRQLTVFRSYRAVQTKCVREYWIISLNEPIRKRECRIWEKIFPLQYGKRCLFTAVHYCHGFSSKSFIFKSWRSYMMASTTGYLMICRTQQA